MPKVATNQERLNELFDSDQRTDTRIADFLGVSKQTISSWRSGKRSPKKSMLQEIAIKYHTSIEWLMGWDAPGPTFPASDSVLSDEEKQFLDAFRLCDSRSRSDALMIMLQHPAAK